MEILDQIPRSVPINQMTLVKWLQETYPNNWISTESCWGSTGVSLRLLRDLSLIELVPNLYNSRTFLYRLSNKGRNALKLRGGNIKELAPLVGDTSSTSPIIT